MKWITGFVVLALAGVCAGGWASRAAYSAPKAPEATAAPAAAATATAFPVMEQYVAAGNLSAFLRDASRFLDVHYDSPFAPRVALDVLVLGVINNDTVTVQRAQAMLVMDYAQTPQGTFALTTFADAGEYRQFLSLLLDDTMDDITSGLAGKFTRAVRGGVRQFGEGLLADPAFALKCVLLARDAQDKQIGDLAFKQFKAAVAKDPARKGLKTVGEICLADNRGRPEKVLLLHAMMRTPEARTFERLLLGKMSTQELASPRLAGVVAESRLRAGRFADALALLEKVPVPRDPAKRTAALPYRKAWCYAAMGQNDKARALLTQLAKDSPKDPLAKSAAVLAGSLRQIDQNLESYADALLAVAAGLRDAGPQVVEGTVSYEREDGVTLSSYVAVAAGELFETSIRRGEQMVLGYSSDKTRCRVYREGWTAIHEYGEPGLLPVPALAIERKPDGSYALNAGFGVKPFGEDVTKALADLLNGKELSNRQAVLDLLRAQVRRGWFPTAVQEVAGGARTYTWVAPRVDGAGLGETWYTISADGRLLRVVSDRLRVQAIRYGRAGSFDPAPPPWPAVKVRTHAKLDTSAILELFPAVVELFAPWE
jgi:tetratricopeptide (TPR) repeat protein